MASSPYAGSRFQVSIDGKFPGFVFSVSGGDITAEVYESKLGAHNVVAKNITTVKYDEITIEGTPAQSGILADWIAASWNGDYQKKDIEVAIADANGNIQMTKTLHGCLLTSVKISACDASSKDNGKWTIKAKPDFSRISIGGGGKVKGDLGKNVAKNWLCSNFRLVIDGLDCTHTGKVQELEWSQKLADAPAGEQREYVNVPASVSWPSLKWEVLAHSGAKTHYDWFKSFVIEGKCGPGDERGGELTMLSADHKRELGSVIFHNLGITKFKYSDVKAGDEKAQKCEMEAYCEKMDVKLGEKDM